MSLIEVVCFFLLIAAGTFKFWGWSELVARKILLILDLRIAPKSFDLKHHAEAEKLFAALEYITNPVKLDNGQLRQKSSNECIALARAAISNYVDFKKGLKK